MQAKRLSTGSQINEPHMADKTVSRQMASRDVSNVWTRLDAQEKQVIAQLSLESVNRYVKTVKELLEEALKAHQVKAGGYFSPLGHFRYLVRVQAVNKELERLRQALMTPSPLHIVMKRLELIRGLLCDILM